MAIFIPSGAPTSIGTEQVKGAYEFVFSNIELSIELFARRGDSPNVKFPRIQGIECVGMVEEDLRVVLEGTAGLGLVMILRWYWWRVNAWSEITATIVPLVVFVLSKFVWKIEFPQSLFLTVGTTTVLWLIITFATKPTDSKVLNDFYMRVKPAFGWAIIVENLNIKPEKSHVLYSGLSLLLSISMTFGLLFFMGKVIFYEFEEAFVWFSVTTLSFGGLWVTSRKAQLW